MVHVVRKTASNSGFTSNKFMFVAYFYLPCVLNGHAQQNGRKMRQEQAGRSDGTFFFHSTCFIAHPAAIKCRLVATLAMNVGPSFNELVYATQTLCPTHTHTDTHRHTNTGTQLWLSCGQRTCATFSFHFGLEVFLLMGLMPQTIDILLRDLATIPSCN